MIQMLVSVASTAGTEVALEFQGEIRQCAEFSFRNIKRFQICETMMPFREPGLQLTAALDLERKNCNKS